MMRAGSVPQAAHKNHQPERWVLIGLLVAALLLTLPFLSGGLDDFDSFSFLLATQRYDLVLQQPQPPGFPFYIGMANALTLLLHDGSAALVLLSALWGAVGVAALAVLGSQLFGQRVGVTAAVGLMALPGWWVYSSVALSDVPGLALPLLALAVIWHSHQARTRWQWWVIGWALAGLSLGVRPHNALLLLVLGSVALWQQRTWLPQAIGSALVAGVIGCLVWFVPQIVATGGLSPFLAALSQHSQHVVSADSLFSPTAGGLAARLTAFAAGYSDLFGGTLGALIFTGLLLLGVVGGRRSGWPMWLCGLWLVLVGGKLFVFESLERTRLYLPLLPPLLLLWAAGWDGLLRRWQQTRGMALLGAGLFLLAVSLSLPRLTTLHAQRSAPEQATAWIRDSYPADSTVLITLGSYRAAQVQLPAYRLLYAATFDATAWQTVLSSPTVQRVVLLDRDDLPAYAIEAVSATDWVTVTDRTFERDRSAFPQHVTVRAQVMMPAAALSAAELTVPATTISLADPENARYLGAGWYRAEDIGGTLARWTEQVAVLRLALPAHDAVLILSASPYPAQQTVQVVVNGFDGGVYTLTGVWEEIRIPLRADWLLSDIDQIELRHSLSEQAGDDPRLLAAAYRDLRVTTAAAH